MSDLDDLAMALGFPSIALPDAASGSMHSAIRFLVDRLIVDGFLPSDSAEKVAKDVVIREFSRLGGDRGQVAMPHMTSPLVDRVIGIVAHCSCPVPWEAFIDSERVRLICLVIAPPGVRDSNYLPLREQIARAIRRDIAQDVW